MNKDLKKYLEEKEIMRIISRKYNMIIFINILLDCINDIHNISLDKKDGFIIGLLYKNSNYIRLMLSDKDIPPTSDQTIGDMRVIIDWLDRNNEKLTKLFNTYKN